MNKADMGSVISKIRKEKNMTQIELAERLNVTDKAVSKWERGISCPDINTIPKLAEILEISPDELMGYSQKDNKYGKDSINEIVQLVLKAVGMAMGIASLVLLILKNGTQAETIMMMLSIGLICFGISSLNEKKRDK